MIENINLVIKEYLDKFPNEKERMALLSDYLKNNSDVFNWNNINGHITVGAFVYCKREDKFLVLYHRDLKMYLYPGGHVDNNDTSLIDAAKRELKEETGLDNLDIANSEIPFDIDTHLIHFNERVSMPEHYHFDFRFLFFIDNVCEIVLDEDECIDYKWISSSELSKDKNYGNIVSKIFSDESYFN